MYILKHNEENYLRKKHQHKSTLYLKIKANQRLSIRQYVFNYLCKTRYLSEWFTRDEL